LLHGWTASNGPAGTKTKMKTTLRQIKEKLGGIADSVSRNKAGNFVARRSYFYSNGQTADGFAAVVNAALPGMVVVSKWNHWSAFKGGASVAAGSHFGVEFTIAEVK